MNFLNFWILNFLNFFINLLKILNFLKILLKKLEKLQNPSADYFFQYSHSACRMKNITHKGDNKLQKIFQLQKMHEKIIEFWFVGMGMNVMNEIEENHWVWWIAMVLLNVSFFSHALIEIFFLGNYFVRLIADGIF